MKCKKCNNLCFIDEWDGWIWSCVACGENNGRASDEEVKALENDTAERNKALKAAAEIKTWRREHCGHCGKPLVEGALRSRFISFCNKRCKQFYEDDELRHEEYMTRKKIFDEEDLRKRKEDQENLLFETGRTEEGEKYWKDKWTKRKGARNGNGTDC